MNYYSVQCYELLKSGHLLKIQHNKKFTKLPIIWLFIAEEDEEEKHSYKGSISDDQKQIFLLWLPNDKLYTKTISMWTFHFMY